MFEVVLLVSSCSSRGPSFGPGCRTRKRLKGSEARTFSLEALVRVKQLQIAELPSTCVPSYLPVVREVKANVEEVAWGW